MRFVILRHETPPGSPRGPHWDVMFDVGPALRTWAVDAAPDSPTEQAALLLPDHRREYLTYEGPVSGDRGTVARWDEGTYELLATAADAAGTFVVRVAGRRLRGVIEISAAPEARFLYRPDDAARV